MYFILETKLSQAFIVIEFSRSAIFLYFCLYENVAIQCISILNIETSQWAMRVVLIRLRTGPGDTKRGPPRTIGSPCAAF